MLTYIGFDGISTLSEEAHDPRRNILLATVLTCLVTGILAASQVYAAQLVWPQLRGLSRRRHRVRLHRRPGRRARPCSSRSTWRSWSPRSAPGPARISPPAGCSTEWAVTTPFPAASSASSIPARRSRATTSCFVGVLALIGAFSLTYQLGRRAAQLRCVHRLHGGEPRGVRALFRARQPEAPSSTCCRRCSASSSASTSGGACDTTAKLAGLAWLAAGFFTGPGRPGGFAIRSSSPSRTTNLT